MAEGSRGGVIRDNEHYKGQRETKRHREIIRKKRLSKKKEK